MKIEEEAVIAIIKQAGREIVMPAFNTAVQTTRKSDGSIVTEADLACQSFIEHALLELHPFIPLLGEEMSEAEQQMLLSEQRIWCLDPIDGTTNFATQIPAFAISLALFEHGKPVFGCIHDPVRNETFTAGLGKGAQLNNRTIHASSECITGNSVGFIDFKRLPEALANNLSLSPFYRSQRNIGTCALEWAWLAAGRGQFIIHGGEKIWDYAAGSLIASEAGCVVGDFSGTTFFPSRTLSSPVLAACNSQLHSAIVQKIKDSQH